MSRRNPQVGNVSPRALNICIPPYFPSKSTVLLRGLKARHIRTNTTSRQPEREQTMLLCFSVQTGTLFHFYLSHGKSSDPADSPDLSRRIWSFWHSSMNPEMRLANSTTYWIAWVIWMAHCCHSTSRGCDRKRKQFRGNSAHKIQPFDTQTGTCCHDLDPHLALVHLDLLVRVCLPSKLLQLIRRVLTCLQVGLDYILSNSVWKTQNVFLIIIIYSRLLSSCVWHVRKRAQGNVCILCTMFRSVGFWSFKWEEPFSVCRSFTA